MSRSHSAYARVPLPKTAKVLQAGAAFDRQIAALLDPETPVEDVTTLKVHPDLKRLGELAVSNGAIPGPSKPRGKNAPVTAPDLAIAARWGYAGQGSVTMPGPGKVTTGTRGKGYLDIHLNATTRWKDVPEAVWNYTLGGYQVLKKWLSYRESALLGRPLPPTKPNNSPTTSAASPASSPCTRNWTRTTGRVFDPHIQPQTPNSTCAFPNSLMETFLAVMFLVGSTTSSDLWRSLR